MKPLTITTLFLLLSTSSLVAQTSIIKPTQQNLMNEVRIAPSPHDGAVTEINPPRFMWPDKHPHLGPVLDGFSEDKGYKPAVTYRIRIAQQSDFSGDVISGECNWAFFNPFQILGEGKWHWQIAYVDANGAEDWSQVYNFIVDKNALIFNPPSFQALVKELPKTHPRIILDGENWDEIIKNNENNIEARQYFKMAKKAISHPLRHISEEIDTTHVVKLTNKVQYRSLLIRESRKIVDREEKYIESLVRAYLLSKDQIYYQEAVKRLTEVLSWRESKYFAGDFNLSTLLLMSTSVYDGCYNVLSPQEKELLLGSIKKYAGHFYHEYVNHLENRIADNHVWQMTFRILTMAAYATLGEIPEATVWADYCYNMWVSRFPGLNSDGSWHNGDAYFHVNMRTLIEVPYLFGRISGFDYFSDPWYNNNVLYAIYHQPPFSKSGGHGSSHESRREPSGVKVGYADALARECNNPWAAAYVEEILSKDPDIMESSFMGKSGDLTWYRSTTPNKRPKQTKSLSELPSCKVFNENGVATMHSSIGDYKNNAMLSFRSSPYGSSSHAQANQNAFNTFYGGQEIFYSSGHRTGFTDDHCMYSYRNTRAHNSILIDGMGQRIGTDGYGWIPRFYEGENISYFVGDASNAYGEITTPIWFKRAELSGIEFTPENGWDKNKLDLFRRHVVQLGGSGLIVIYDELAATEPVQWSYMLHTRDHKMEIEQSSDMVEITGKNDRDGVSTAYLFCSTDITTDLSDKFFTPPVDWLNKHKGEFENHWHFTAKSGKTQFASFLTIVDTRNVNDKPLKIKRNGNKFTADGWVIIANLDGNGQGSIEVKNKKEGSSLKYDITQNEGKTIIVDKKGSETINKELADYLPKFEI